MKVTPTFALSSPFLIWVAKKNLVHCDLDLVMFEYYKERLKSELKNRETHMIEDKLTEPTVLNISNLPISFDLIFTLEFSSIRLNLFLVTLSYFTLFLSSLLTLSILLVFCHNDNICSYP